MTYNSKKNKPLHYSNHKVLVNKLLLCNSKHDKERIYSDHIQMVLFVLLCDVSADECYTSVRLNDWFITEKKL